MQAALGLIRAGPPPCSWLFAGKDRPGRRRATDRQVSSISKGVNGQPVVRRVTRYVSIAPSGKGVDLHHLPRLVPPHNWYTGTSRRIASLEPGHPCSAPLQRVCQGLDLAELAAALRSAGPFAGTQIGAQHPDPEVVVAPDRLDESKSLREVETRIEEQHLYSGVDPYRQVDQNAVLEGTGQDNIAAEPLYGPSDDIQSGSRLELPGCSLGRDATAGSVPDTVGGPIPGTVLHDSSSSPIPVTHSDAPGTDLPGGLPRTIHDKADHILGEYGSSPAEGSGASEERTTMTSTIDLPTAEPASPPPAELEADLPATRRWRPPADHLTLLEAHAVFVMREVASECERPALLFSGGKDSAVLLRLAEKAFRPGPFPFPVVHIDTGHNFPEVIAFRDRRVAELGERLLVASVDNSIAAGRVADPGPGASRNRLQSVTLLDAIADNGFDACIGGARRDEDKARAKERVLSFRDAFGHWDPRNQRPELWHLYHGRVNRGEHVRAFPMSDWTELDVWQYIRREGIDLPSLYFAHPRDVVERDGMLLAVSEWVVPLPGETVEHAMVRFRTVGDATCTGAVRSTASTLDQVIAETATSRISERGATRADDRFSETAMEDRKREGYF